MRLSHPKARPLVLSFLLTAAGALSMSPVTAANDNSEVSVKGVIRPSACRIAISEDGKVNYGTISATAVSRSTAGFAPGQREVLLTVHCELGTRVGVAIRDNRAGSRADIAGINPYGFGLGMFDEFKLGAYTVTPAATATTETGEAQLLISEDNGVNWAPSTLRMIRADGVAMFSWAEPGTTTPAARRQFQTSLRVDAYLPKADALPSLDQSIELDGSSTLSLIYL